MGLKIRDPSSDPIPTTDQLSGFGQVTSLLPASDSPDTGDKSDSATNLLGM